MNYIIIILFSNLLGFYIKDDFKYYIKYNITHIILNNKEIELFNYVKCFILNNNLLIKGSCIEAIYKFKIQNNYIKIIYKQLYNIISCDKKIFNLEKNILKIIEKSYWFSVIGIYKDWKILISQNNNFLIMKFFN